MDVRDTERPARPVVPFGPVPATLAGYDSERIRRTAEFEGALLKRRGR
jgi:hypothetical protein